MSAWVMVVYIYAGVFADTDSVTVTQVQGFKTEQGCIEAGNKGKVLVANTKKEYKFVCMELK